MAFSSFHFARCFRLIILGSGLFFSLGVTLAFAQRTEVDLSGAGWTLWRDEQAAWQNDALYPPGTALDKIPTNEPTGGWDALAKAPGMQVAIPGTVEQYLYHLDPAKPESKHSTGMPGVSWWYRTLSIPASATGKQVILHFESTRYRAEVYVDHKLVFYNLVEGTPFDVNLTGLVTPGKDAALAVRITSPGGWWSWEDCNIQPWGTTKTMIPLSRGFSGITGPVKLLVVNPTRIDDVYVQNTPAMHDVNVQVALVNATDKPETGKLTVDVSPKTGDKSVVHQEMDSVTAPPGESTQTVKISYPDAQLWDLDHPNLYKCTVHFGDSTTGDSLDKQFGFRWFAPEDIGSNAVFRLNGKRVVLRTAISWGLWGTTGIVPSPELAARQIDSAKELGLNMLNFHRAVGQPWVLDDADEKGLMYFEEPGCYVDGSADPFCEPLVREKLLRMVKRDRSHPSLVIYNMINEQWTKYDADKPDKNPIGYTNFQTDMAAAHKIDPSRVIVLASAWSRVPPGQPEKVKLNMRPFDDKQYDTGWFDFHRASGDEMWKQSFYKGPDDHYMLTKDKVEIVYWGEEGAISSPPRLELIKKEVDPLEHKGWDGEVYLNWYNQTDDFLNKKNLRSIFPTVDSFTVALSAVAMEHQGRKIEDLRICNLDDGYAVNGWEAEPYENHSGVVDCFRNPKGDPKLISYYNQPLFVSVKTRNQVVQAGDPAIVDFYIINEKDVKGAHNLHVEMASPDGKVVAQDDYPVTITGGEVFSELLAEAVKMPTNQLGGMYKITASLKDSKGTEIATGRDQILAVNWKDSKLTGNGAIYENGSDVHDFLKTQKGLDVPAYTDSLGALDWVLVARPPISESSIITPSFFRLADGKTPGATVTFFNSTDFTAQTAQHTVNQVQFHWDNGAAPDPSISAGAPFSVRWSGTLVPPATGGYLFAVKAIKGSVELKVNGTKVDLHKPVNLTGGEPVSYELSVVPDPTRGDITLSWTAPQSLIQNAASLLARAQKDGTTIILADYADEWMPEVKAAAPIQYDTDLGANKMAKGKMPIGGSWVGGAYFAVESPLFKDLPVNQAMNWPYQGVVNYGRSDYGLKMSGEQLAAGCWQSVPFGYATAVGTIPSGKGQIIFSTLNICPHLQDTDGPSEVARKLLCNYLEAAMQKGK